MELFPVALALFAGLMLSWLLLPSGEKAPEAPARPDQAAAPEVV